MSAYQAEKAAIEAAEKELAARRAKLDELREQELEVECVEMKKKIISLGIRPERLFGKEDILAAAGVVSRRTRQQSGTKRPPKYRNPDNPAETFAGGGGPKPKWYKNALAAGVLLKDLEIPVNGA